MMKGKVNGHWAPPSIEIDMRNKKKGLYDISSKTKRGHMYKTYRYTQPLLFISRLVFFYKQISLFDLFIVHHT